MYPAAFDYYAPKHIKEVLGLLGKLKDDAKILSGGHSLIPMMKLRLAQPKHLVDLRKVPGLAGIKVDGKALALGASAVGIGRPHAWGLAAFGQPGVEAVLEILRRELRTIMRQAGTTSVDKITRNYIVGRSA